MTDTQNSGTEQCPACGDPVEATVTMMYAHLTLDCDETEGRSVHTGGER